MANALGTNKIKTNDKYYLADPVFRNARLGNRNPETFEREYTPLLAIKDAYPKMILARTHQERYQYEGIQIVDIAEWLLKE